MKFQLHKRKTFLYFIPISEVNAYLKQIKVLLPTMTKISYFFTSEEYDLYFFTAANRCYSTIQGFISSRKDLECIVHVWHHATDVRTSNKAHDVTL